jgi:hypothetical protein
MSFVNTLKGIFGGKKRKTVAKGKKSAKAKAPVVKK